MTLRIEINKNWRGKWDVREGDLGGSTERTNLDEEGVIEEIKFLLKREEAESNTCSK